METHTSEISASASKCSGGTADLCDDPDEKIIESVTYGVRSEVVLACESFLTSTENLLFLRTPLRLAGTGRDYVTKWKGAHEGGLSHKIHQTNRLTQKQHGTKGDATKYI